jgi:putative hydrolase of the HAD superfamily
MLKMVTFDLGNAILDEERDREVELSVRPAFPMPGVMDALPQIRLPMGIWANTTAATVDDVRQWLNRAALDHFFSCIVTSTDAGYRKPDRRPFVHALATCGCRADEVLFVGNQLNSDIAGANACGILSVFLTDHVYRSRDDTKVDTKPTYNIGTLKELPELLARIRIHV